MIKTKNLVLADLRIYEKDKGALLDDEMPKVFLVKKNGKYYNVFNNSEEYPLFKRIPYSNVRDNGECYGTKLIPENVDELDEIGICAIESDEFLIRRIREKEEITIKELEQIVIDNKHIFFKDRDKIIVDNYQKEKENIINKNPIMYDKNYFRSIYRFKTRIKMKTRFNNLLRIIKNSNLEKKYSKLLPLAERDALNKTHYNKEVEKVKQKVR